MSTINIKKKKSDRNAFKLRQISSISHCVVAVREVLLHSHAFNLPLLQLDLTTWSWVEQTPLSGQPFTQYDGGCEYGLITIDVLMLAGLNIEVLRLSGFLGIPAHPLFLL